VVTQPASADEIPADEIPAAPEAAPADDAQPSPYQAGLQSIYQNENPDLIDLVQRVKHQESRGNQGAVSPKGAIGIMQVMPDTAPEAARLAGVPWDPQAFHSDAAYNEILGIAYLSELLRKYGGDVSRALAAYNAGPGATDHAMASHGDAWLTAMPAETQDYVARVG
jgi:soluble lytic murein transglycosylase-like protein